MPSQFQSARTHLDSSKHSSRHLASQGERRAASCGQGAPSEPDLDAFRLLRSHLQGALKRVGGMLLTDHYTRLETNDLMACADCYVSLHRAEGFGLGLAEAMYLGKPAIATNYSGNVDFMTPENSYLVEYRLRKVVAEDQYTIRTVRRS